MNFTVLQKKQQRDFINTCLLNERKTQRVWGEQKQSQDATSGPPLWKWKT